MYTTMAKAAAQGRVKNQALIMLPATFQRTADLRVVAPTPIMAEVMVWVVEIGAWNWKAAI